MDLKDLSKWFALQPEEEINAVVLNLFFKGPEWSGKQFATKSSTTYYLRTADLVRCLYTRLFFLGEGQNSNAYHVYFLLLHVVAFSRLSKAPPTSSELLSLLRRRRGLDYLGMPSQEATMPPTLPYPYSSNEEFSSSPSDSPEISTEDVSSNTAKSISSTDAVEEHQGDTGYINFCDQGRFSCANKSRDMERQHHLQGKDGGNKTKGGHSIGAGAFTSLFNSSFSEIHENTSSSAPNPGCGALASQGASKDFIAPTIPKITPGKPLGLPGSIFARIVLLLDRNSLLNARATSGPWLKVCEKHRPLQFSALYRLPVELIQLILMFTSPSTFNAARHVCRAWYLSALEPSLLRLQLKGLGFYHADYTVRNSPSIRYLSARLSREFSLGAGESGICGLRKTTIIDMSNLAATSTVHFTVSICGSYALLSEGCVVYVYRLQATIGSRMEFVASVVCPRRVLAVSMDTSSRRFAIAILLDGRMGLVHDVVEQEAKSTYRNLCSEEDSPRSVAICPQRRCVAFGCHGGIELHWVDALTGQDLNRWFPLTAPSDFLYFLPPRRGIDSAKKLRLISSAVHPKEASPLTKRFGVSRGSLAFWGSWEPRAGQSDHFQAVPLSDGYHILFMDPETGGLCLGSDAPLGGPTKLLRKIWLIPPSVLGRKNEPNEEMEGLEDVWKAEERDLSSITRPSVYASGADIRFGVRVVAGYRDHIVLFSIPPDVFDGSKKQSGAQHSTLGSEGRTVTSGMEQWKPVNIHGCHVGTVSRLIDLAVDSGPNMTVYAFSASGQVVVYQLEKTIATVTAGGQSKVARMVSRRNGEIVGGLVEENEKSRGSRRQVSARLDGEVESDGGWGTNLYLQGLKDSLGPGDHSTGRADEYEFYNGCRIDCLLAP